MSYLYKRVGAAPRDSSVKASIRKMVPAGILYMTNDTDPIVVLAQPKYKETADAAARYWKYLHDTNPPRKPQRAAKPKLEQDQTHNNYTMTDQIIAAMAEQGSQ